MWEPDGSAVVSHNEWNLVLANALLDNLAQFEASLLLGDLVGMEPALHVIENSEVFFCLFNSNNIHLSEWISWVSADLTVDLDVSVLVLDDLLGLVSGQSVLQSQLEEHVKRDAFSQFVGSSRWPHGVHTL